MSFSMTNVKIKSKTKFNPREYYSYVYNNPLLTDNVRYALKRYMDFRLSKRCLGLNIQKQKDMINDLLQFCCNKPYLNIKYSDVYNNENEIIYQIKRAIYYGATKCLYNAHKEDNTVYTVSDNIVPVYFTTLSKSQLSNRHTVEEYFSELR